MTSRPELSMKFRKSRIFSNFPKRVQSVADPGQARITFEMALDEIRSFPGREREFFFEQAQQIAAAFYPSTVERHFCVGGVHAQMILPKLATDCVFYLRQSPVFVELEQERVCLGEAPKIPGWCLPVLLWRLLPQVIQISGLQDGCP